MTPCVKRPPKQKGGGSSPSGRADRPSDLGNTQALVLPSGEVKIDFDLCDSVTSFQVLACGHSADGRLGSTTIDIE